MGFDPGPITAYARANDRGQLIDYDQIPIDDLAVKLEAIPTVALKKAYIEGYRIFAKKVGAHRNQKPTSSEAIGIIKSWCARHGIPYVEQGSDILPIAERFTQMKIPGGRAHADTHWVAAWNHLHYGMVKEGLCMTQEGMRRAAEREVRKGLG